MAITRQLAKATSSVGATRAEKEATSAARATAEVKVEEEDQLTDDEAEELAARDAPEGSGSDWEIEKQVKVHGTNVEEKLRVLYTNKEKPSDKYN